MLLLFFFLVMPHKFCYLERQQSCAVVIFSIRPSIRSAWIALKVTVIAWFCLLFLSQLSLGFLIRVTFHVLQGNYLLHQSSWFS